MKPLDPLPESDLPNHYVALGVPREASLSEIKKAFHQLSLRWHPDKAGNSAEVHGKYVRALESYEVLRDAEKRQAYDAALDDYKTKLDEWLEEQKSKFRQKFATDEEYERALADQWVLFHEMVQMYKEKSDEENQRTKEADEALGESFFTLSSVLHQWECCYGVPGEADESRKTQSIFPIFLTGWPTVLDGKADKNKFIYLLQIGRQMSRQIDILKCGPRSTEKMLHWMKDMVKKIRFLGPCDEPYHTDLWYWIDKKAIPRLKQLIHEAENLAIAIERTSDSTTASMYNPSPPRVVYGEIDADSDTRSDAGSTGNLDPDTIYGLYRGLDHNITRLDKRIFTAWGALHQIQTHMLAIIDWKADRTIKIERGLAICDVIRKWIEPDRE